MQVSLPTPFDATEMKAVIGLCKLNPGSKSEVEAT